MASMPQNLPVQRSTSEKRINLALMALFAFYVIQIVANSQPGKTCQYAVDYCAFWSVGHVANTAGYASVYNLAVLAQAQKPLFSDLADPASFVIVPVPFFPIFILPFQMFALIELLPGFVIWSFINLIGFIIYIYFFSQKIFGRSLPLRLSLMFLLSLPVFMDLYLGQVNLWLMICAGEFVRAMIEGRGYRAGFWLGGLLLKPQLLLLIIPVLILQRMLKVLLGFGISGAVIFVTSVGLAGFKGIYDLVMLWLVYTKGLPSNSTEVMMNWRMVAVNFNNFNLSFIGWFITIAGMLVTLIVVFLIWRKPIPIESPNFHIALLGLLAATGLIAWHSHLSTSMILIPTLILLYHQKQFPQRIFSFWIFLPPAARFIAPLLIVILIPASILSVEVKNVFINALGLFYGLPGLILNIGFFAWSYLMVCRGNDRV